MASANSKCVINGHKVESSHESIRMNGSVISFSDSSWVNLSTGQHKVVSGWIKLDGKFLEGTSGEATHNPDFKVETIRKSFSATALRLDGVRADVRVEAYRGLDIQYEATGPAELIKEFTVEVEEGNCLVVSGGPSGGFAIGGSNAFFSSSVSITDSFRGRRSQTTVVSIGRSEVSLTLRVPIGTPVSSLGVRGDVVVGDIEAPLMVRVSGSGDVEAGRVGSAHIEIDGSGDVDVEFVRGDVSVEVSKSGDVKVRSGEIDRILAISHGSGDIKVGGTAATADLASYDSGDIRVSHVLSEPRKTKRGSGRIKVKRIGA